MALKIPSWTKYNPWERLYRSKGVIEEIPSAQVMQLVPMFQQNNVERILDHGCGTGRHVKYLAGLGFHVYGMDSSLTAIKYTKEAAKGLEDFADVVVADMDVLPYSDGFFDATISSKVIHHALKRQREGAISEIKRTLKSNGLVFLRTRSITHPAYGKGEKIEENTFANIPGIVSGEGPQHFFSKEELLEYFSDFDIIRLNLVKHSPDYFSIYGMHEWSMLARKK
ncbi:MAG: class I SAM-dependent methyltransferase [Candidatus Aenigmatarchaeota archaeon]